MCCVVGDKIDKDERIIGETNLMRFSCSVAQLQKKNEDERENLSDSFAEIQSCTSIFQRNRNPWSTLPLKSRRERLEIGQ